MGSSQRLAAVAAVSHARHYYNHTQPEVHTEVSSYNINIFFVSATLCGVLVAVCAACWRRSPSPDKPEDAACHGVYTVSGDARLLQEQVEIPGPPPAYETVVEGPPPKDNDTLQVRGNYLITIFLNLVIKRRLSCLNKLRIMRNDKL
ncbi:uncharacterized protein LOC113505293 isoform X1 [Trichoplusia ni]|uniref:Uncharacterized protein LOC113505293 isoform X1 n=1 Tax=Trichoplusia ni TaxID=7111 RepID=A0A7E5WSD4_TRINI|nr:uncharacterized protein LOC113505293 isoform X1 [Trichoplusia ni]